MNAQHIHPTQSSLMQAYNFARLSHKFSPKRLNHALSLAQSNGVVYLPNGDVEVPSLSGNGFYLISAKYSCDCEDYRRHQKPISGFSQRYLKPEKRWFCQHILARLILRKAWDLDTIRKENKSE